MTEQERREKVVKGLECCLPAHDPDCDLCPYDDIDLRCRAKLRDDIIALLKTQEPVIVKCTTKRTLVDDTYEVVYQDETFYDCPACGQRLSRWNKDTQIKYCWTCGQAVKWND